MRNIEVISNSSHQTEKIGEVIASVAEAGDIILLLGELGSGKTCLTHGIARGMNIYGYVSSPSFVLVREHKGRLNLYHIDLYRLNSNDEIEALGIDEYLFGQGVSVIEWADRGKQIFPEDNISVRLQYLSKNRRRLDIQFNGENYEKRFDAFVSELRGRMNI